MVSNDCKEKCRDFGMLVENIICMADCYEEPIEKFRKSMFYKPEFEDKEKIILDMIDTSNRVSEEIKLLSIEDLKKLQDEYGIELIGYTDMLATALRKEPYLTYCDTYPVVMRCASLQLELNLLYAFLL